MSSPCELLLRVNSSIPEYLNAINLEANHPSRQLLVERNPDKFPRLPFGNCVMRVINAEIWIRVAQLYYKEGRIYTFGDMFNNVRENLEEYVFWPASKMSSLPHFQITCKNGTFFFRNLETPHLMKETQSDMLVNGSKFWNKTLKLNFGDVFSMQSPTKENNRTDFIFIETGPSFNYKRLIYADLFEDDGALSTTDIIKSLQNLSHKKELQQSNINEIENTKWNPLILSKILSHLGLEDLKNSSLVCTQWDHEARRHLTKTSTVSFSLSDFCPSQSHRFFCYRQNSKFGIVPPSKHITFQVSLCTCMAPYHGNYRTCHDWAGSPSDKFYHDLNSFLIKDCDNNAIKLVVEIECKYAWDRFGHLLKSGAENIDEIELRHHDIAFNHLGLFSFDTVKLPFLRKLVLKSIDRPAGTTNRGVRGELNGEDKSINLWVKSLTRMAGDLKEINLCSKNLVINRLILEEISLGAFPQLNSFGISGVVPSILEMMTNLSCLKHLKSLSIAMDTLFPAVVVVSTVPILENVLKSLAQKLRRLDLNLPAGYGPIELPRFPKLTEFKVLEDFHSTFNFESGFLDYEQHLPNLVKLEITRNEKIEFFDTGIIEFTEIFVPLCSKEVCKTLKYFKAPILIKNTVNETLDDSIEGDYCSGQDELISKVSKMFPKLVAMETEREHGNVWETTCGKNGKLCPMCEGPIEHN